MSENLPVPTNPGDITILDLTVQDNFTYGKTPTAGYVITCVDSAGNSEWQAGPAGSYLPLAGGTMAGNIAMGGNNISAAGSISMTNLTFNNIIFPYAPLTGTLTSQIDFFGDSVAIGLGLSSPATQRWPALLCTASSKTENNLAISGDQTNDMAVRIYGTAGAGGAAGVGHVFNAATGVGNSVFLAIGVNDIRLQSSLYAQQQFTCLESVLLWCCLPAAKAGTTPSNHKLWDARHSDVVKSGTVVNLPAYNIGVAMQTLNATLTLTVNGRYVVVGGASSNSTSGSITACVNYSVTIDGVVQQSAIPVLCQLNNTVNGAGFSQYLYLYDTGSAGATQNHTLVVTKVANTGSPSITNLYVNYMGAFDVNQANCSTVVICSPSTFDFYRNQSGTTPTVYSATQEYYFDLTKNYYARTAARWRTEYGLPVYYCDMSNAQFMGMMQADGLHPNTSGQTYLYSRVNTVLTNGSYASIWGT